MVVVAGFVGLGANYQGTTVTGNGLVIGSKYAAVVYDRVLSGAVRYPL